MLLVVCCYFWYWLARLHRVCSQLYFATNLSTKALMLLAIHCLCCRLYTTTNSGTTPLLRLALCADYLLVICRYWLFTDSGTTPLIYWDTCCLCYWLYTLLVDWLCATLRLLAYAAYVVGYMFLLILAPRSLCYWLYCRLCC